MNYDFSQLNDKEFENLVTDLLSALFNKRIERFSPGPDGGVDGRFFSDDSKEIVIQCKHYLKTGYSGLISNLKNKEKVKVEKLKPSRYLVVTSLPLTRNKKKNIRAIFAPFLKRDDDIFGQEDLNDLLSVHCRIEEKHFKLWISSTNVLQRLLNNAIKGRSTHEIQQIQSKSYKYVQTEAHGHALERLRKNQVLIISGEPGIGKTTLAENVCLFMASKDYEFIDIEESLSEAENVYVIGEPQIFYFDDFLGSNYFEAIENKKDSHIIKFIERVRSDSSKLFVLTSRTNILNSGVFHSPVLSNKAIRKDEFLLTIDKLSSLDKARILYNHIWFSNLSEDFIERIYEEKRYKKIIKHPNFNPRLVEFLTDLNRIEGVTSENYWTYIQDTLNNPEQIWSDCFKVQNNAFVRGLVALVVFNGGEILEADLKAAYNCLVQIEDLSNPSHTEKDFKSTAQLATKSFLRRDQNRDSEISYSLFNPSISDYLLREYGRELQKLINIYKSLRTLKSLKMLISLCKQEIILETHANKIKERLIDEARESDHGHDYLLYLSSLFPSEGEHKSRILQFISDVVTNPAPIAEFKNLLKFLRLFKIDLGLTDYSFLLTAISHRYLMPSEISELSEFIVDFNVKDENLIAEICESVDLYARSELESRKGEIDLDEFVSWYQSTDDANFMEVDEDSIRNKIYELTESIIEENFFEAQSNLGLQIDIADIADDVQVDELVEGHFDSWEPDDDYFLDRGGPQQIDDIDDLFERT